MCQGCDYYSACVGSITGDSYGGDLTKEEATAFADRIYDDWERDNYRKDYPRTWRIRLALHRLYGRVFRVWYKYRSWKIKRELAKNLRTVDIRNWAPIRFGTFSLGALRNTGHVHHILVDVMDETVSTELEINVA